MRTLILLVSLLYLLGGCSGSEDLATPASSGPTGDVWITSPASNGTYTTYQDTLSLSGNRIPSISEVTWENISTGATGTAFIGSYTHWCWFFYYYECTDYYWDATASVQEGENLIRIYGNGAWADSITVTRAPSFGVSGTVAFNNAGQLNIKLLLVDATNPSSSHTAYTDTVGFYHFTVIPAGTYTLTPSDPCYTFTPASRVVTGTKTDITGMDFAINDKQGATISGRIVYAVDGSGVFGASLGLSPALMTSSTTTVQSNRDGYYTFTCVPDGPYVITPDPNFLGVSCLSYNPVDRSVTVVNGADISGQDFQASFVY